MQFLSQRFRRGSEVPAPGAPRTPPAVSKPLPDPALAALRLGVDELRRYGHHDVPLALQSLLPASLATR